MRQRQTVTVQQGIWIDRAWLIEAGLDEPLEIRVRPGEIRISPASGETERPVSQETAWEGFLGLGRDATPGRLSRPSEEHDRHLYGSGE